MKHVFTFLAFVLMSSGFAQESEVPPNPNSSQTAAGVFGGDDHIWLTDAEFLNFGQSSFTAHVRFRSTDLSNLNECCGYQTLIAKGASGGTGNKGFNLDLRGEPDNARINCNFISSAGNNLYLVAPIEENVWYDLVYVVDWSNELATLFVNGIVADEGSIAGLGSMDNDWYAVIGRYVWNNDDGNDAHFLRGEMSWLRMIEGADYELGSDPCLERENPLFELDEFTAEEVAAQVNSVFNLDEVVSIESQCETIVQVFGCVDPAACNFMPAATEDDGSCVMQPQEIWLGEQLFSLEEELALAVSGVDYVIWSDNMTENPLTVVESGTYGVTMVNGDLNEMSQSVSTGPGSCGVIEAGSDWKADQFTVGLWLKLDNANRGYILMEGEDGWLDDFGLALQCIDGFIELDVNHLNLGLTSVNLNDGNWHAVHVMYDGGAIQLYIDGALNMDVSFEDTIDQNDWPIVLGSKKSYECTTNDGSGSVFEGSLSRLSIWSRTLEPWELMESITCGERFVGESLVGLWPLDGSGASDELVALAGETGVNHGMAVVEDSPVGSCSRCATSDWVEVVLATDLCGEGTVWDASAMTCVVANPSDTDFDGCVSMTDLLDLLTVFGTCAETESEPELGEWSCGDPLEYQGYDYETVQIGEQCWFAENCRYLPYLNEVGDGSDTEPRYYILYEDHTDLLQAQESPSYLEYGALYNLPAVLVGEELCPSGWHIPNIQEWEELGAFASDLGPNSLKDESWGGGASGFDAKAAGHRANYGDYIREFEESDFWSVTVEPNCVNHVARLMSDEVDLMTSDLMLHCESGNSVRCIQDSE